MKPQKTQKSLTKREKLALLTQQSGLFIRAKDAKKALQLSSPQASKTLSIWAKQGWLKRVFPGVYTPIPFNELNSDDYILDDPWLLMPEVFSSHYYIGGFSAASYWGLTDQTFRNTFVFTTKPLRAKEMIIQNYKFIIKNIKKDKMFAREKVWRGGTKIFISDIYKTLVDMLDDPLTGGGIQHVFHCFENFIKDKKSHRLRHRLSPRGITVGRRFLREEVNWENIKKQKIVALVKSAKKNKNGAVFKRLGFFAERVGEKYLADLCKKELTKGYSKLDTSLKCNRLNSKWRLWIPKNLKLERQI